MGRSACHARNKGDGLRRTKVITPPCRYGYQGKRGGVTKRKNQSATSEGPQAFGKARSFRVTSRRPTEKRKGLSGGGEAWLTKKVGHLVVEGFHNTSNDQLEMWEEKGNAAESPRN